MLVLARHENEQIIFRKGDTEIIVTVVAIRGDKVRLGCAAPADVTIHRAEVQRAIDRAAHDGQPAGVEDGR